MKPSLNGMLRGLLALLIFAGVFCALAYAEDPLQVTACQLKNDPATYNHQLIEVTAFVSHDFEDFSLFDPGCPSRYDIWLEYGGTATSGTIYCCPGDGDSRSRAHQLVIDDIPIPLLEDGTYHAFDKLLQEPFSSGRFGSIVHATIVGRFFAGRKDRFHGDRWSGYGHMGCCTLLAIQEIRSVDTQDRTDLDYGASPDQPDIDKLNCGYRDLVAFDPSKEIIAAQHQAELGQKPWAFEDPGRVASTELATLLKIPATSIKNMKLVRTGQGRVVYQWKPGVRKLRHMVVVSRPYWLAFYSKDANRVAWVVVAAYSVCE